MKIFGRDCGCDRRRQLLKHWFANHVRFIAQSFIEVEDKGWHTELGMSLLRFPDRLS